MIRPIMRAAVWGFTLGVSLIGGPAIGVPLISWLVRRFLGSNDNWVGVLALVLAVALGGWLIVCMFKIFGDDR